MSEEKVKCESGSSTKAKDNSIGLDEDLKNENPYAEEQRETLRQKALSDGRIIDPLIIWKGKDYLVWGYVELEIAQEHNLPYETKELDFESKADCLAWIAEKRLATPSLNLFQKIEIGERWWEYWRNKDEAKHGKESPLRKAALERCGRDDKLAIVALKAGTSHNTVNKVNNILKSDNQDVISQCRQGEISISGANDLINGVDSNKGQNDSNKQDEVSEKKVPKAEKEKPRGIKQKEIDALANYSVNGFASKKVKLDKKGLNFFVLRWNDEHPENCIKEEEIQKAIDNFGKDKKMQVCGKKKSLQALCDSEAA